MNPFMEPTVARPLPAGTRLAGQVSQPDQTGTSAGKPAGRRSSRANPPTGRRRRRPNRSSGRLPLARSVLVAGLFGLAGVLFPLSASAVDINLASAQELQTLKGIGPKTAENILVERDRGGPYASLIDLSERVKGIGPKKLAALKDAGLVVGPADGKSSKTVSAASKK